MPVIAANATAKTNGFLSKILLSKKFLEFSYNTDLDLQKNSILVRLAIINLIKNPPSERDIASYKIALLTFGEFDNFMEKYPKWNVAP